jgi:predicted nucleotidyltransferase
MEVIRQTLHSGLPEVLFAVAKADEEIRHIESTPSMRYIPAMPAPDLTSIREFKRHAEEALPGRIVRVVLYGSRARGDARPDSDWDIAVFLRDGPSSDDRRILSDIGFDLMMEHGNHVQVIAIDAARSAEHSSFLRNVCEDGIAA